MSIVRFYWFGSLREGNFLVPARKSPKNRPKGGSDGSAASGGKSDLSEWPRSARDEGAPSPRTFAASPQQG